MGEDGLDEGHQVRPLVVVQDIQVSGAGSVGGILHERTGGIILRAGGQVLIAVHGSPPFAVGGQDHAHRVDVGGA